MIKECPVIINNAAVTVVKFDDIYVQLPSIGTNDKTVIVNRIDGKYTIVSDSDDDDDDDSGDDETEEKAYEFKEDLSGVHLYYVDDSNKEYVLSDDVVNDHLVTTYTEA